MCLPGNAFHLMSHVPTMEIWEHFLGQLLLIKGAFK